MARFHSTDALGTQLRALLDRIDGDVARALTDLGLVGYRPRFSPMVRASPNPGRPASAILPARPG